MSIRKNDEHWVDNLIGINLNARIHKAIHDRAKDETLEYLIERYKSGKINDFKTHETCFVASLGNKKKIDDISINIPNDLLLDNWGLLNAAQIKAYNTSSLSATLINTANAEFIAKVWNYTSGNFYGYTGTCGNVIQLGSGSTAVARTDYKIETALGSSPENAAFSTTNGSYAGNIVSWSGSCTAGGSGTVRESSTQYRTGTTYVLYTHENLASGVAYTAGKVLYASYALSI